MGAHNRIRWIQAEPKQAEIDVSTGTFHQSRFVGIEDRATVPVQRVGNEPLYVRQLIEICDAEIIEVIFGNVCDQCRICMSYRQPPTQQAATCGFQYGKGHSPIAQNGSRTARPRVIAAVDDVIIDRDPVS